MVPGSHESQLELFDVANRSRVAPPRETLGRLMLQMRYDQLVVASIIGLLSVTVVFACGVERGKRLVRSERMWLARQQAAATQAPVAAPVTDTVLISEARSKRVTATPKSHPKPTPAPSAAPRPKKATKVASSASEAGAVKSRYAIQLVTYSRPHLAKREMDRLQARGERAFLVMRNGRTIVYAGPFPSKGNASEKLTRLKSRYQDCFVRTL